MVEAGLAMHRRTWDPAEIEATIDRELREAGRTLDGRPHTVAHLWPALPGSGVTPVLYGYLAGLDEQRIKPSSHGQHFARYFVERWNRHDDSVCLSDAWDHADHVVISGTDETVAAVEATMGAARVTGYGHRVSFAIVEPDGAPERWADDLATDIVMWHQQGCFSARAVFYAGADPHAFGAALGDAIARAELALDATLDQRQLAHRMQRRGAAEFETTVFGSGLGWVELRDHFDGSLISPHTVTLVPFHGDHLPLGVPPRHTQGVALGVPAHRRAHWAAVATAVGATRVCAPGELQMPPASWPHDGRSNVFFL